jgi:hypothetical protein
MTNKQKYQNFCQEEFNIPIFSQPFWLDAVCGEENWDAILYEKRGVIIASMPYYIRKRYGISYITQPKFTQTLGPWIKYPKDMTYGKKLSFEKEVMNALIEQLEKLSVVFFQQSFNFKITNWLPFYWKGYSQTTNYTYRIEDISDVEKSFEHFHGSIKNNIRKSLKQGLTISFDLPAKDFYKLHKNSLQKKGKLLSFSFDLFSRIYETVYKNNCGRVIYATDQENNLHCAKLFIYDRNSAYYLISILDPDYRKSMSQTLLIYEALKYFSDKTKSFDFEGSMIESVEASNMKFGAVQTPYFRITKTYTKNPFLCFLINTKLKR